MSDTSNFPTATVVIEDQVHEVELGSQELVDQFYRIAGYAINQWAHIDQSVFDCFCWVLNTTEQKAAIVYYSMMSTAQRLALTDELFKSISNQSLVEEWAALLSEQKALTPIRNILAHQPINCISEIMNISHIDPDKKFQVENWLEVSIDPKEMLRGRRKSRTIKIEELQTYAQNIQKFHSRLAQFCGRLKSENV